MITRRFQATILYPNRITRPYRVRLPRLGRERAVSFLNYRTKSLFAVTLRFKAARHRSCEG